MIYAMSDIHGCYEKYRDMLETIKFAADDTLYVLGDVLDRGPDGFKILLDMAARPNVVGLLGNHELLAAVVLPPLLRTMRQGEEQPDRIFHCNTMIGIDCGCAYPGGRLGCLCLDTMEEFYV